MADPLADALNRISANPQSADVAAAPAAQPKLPPRLDPISLAFGDRLSRILATTLPEVGSTIASAPTALYGLADMGLNWATGKRLPGADTANAVTDAIQKPVREMSNNLAGEPVSDNLLSGDPSQLAGSWLRLALGAGISAPAGAARVIADGANKLKTGIGIVDALGTGAARTLEALTPITITTNPSKAVAATNIAVAGAIGSTLEGLLGPQTTVQQAKAMVDEKAKGALDVAAQGGDEVRHNDPHLIQAGLTGDSTYDAIGLTLLAAGALGYWKRDAISKAMYDMRYRIQKTALGYDPRDPIDGTMQSPLTQFVQQNLDRNIGMETGLRKALNNAGYRNADSVANEFTERAASRSGASVNTRMQALYNEGALPDSVVKVRPINDWYTQYHALEPNDQQLLDRALHSQREIDTRRIDNIWHNLYTTPTRELESYVTQARANPQVSYLMSDFLNTTRKLTDYMKEQKRFTAKEVNTFATKNPNYVPERLTEDGARYLDERKIQMNGGLEKFEQLGSPAEFLPKYLDEVVRSSEGKKIQRDFMNLMERERGKGNTYVNQMLGRTLTTPPPHNSAGLFTHWRNSFGESRWTEIKDAVVRDSLRDATNPTALQLTNGALTGLTRVYESGAVGTLGTLTGSIFAPKSAMYTTTIGTVMRPQGIAMGWLDKYVQHLSGGKFGLPGDIATMVPDVAMRAATNVAAVMAHRGSRVLHNSVLTDGNIQKFLGPTAAKSAADALDKWYKRSAVYDLQQRGLLGPASFMAIDPAKSYGNAKAMLENKGMVLGAHSFISDMLHAVTSAPAMSVIAMNKGKDARVVNSAIRNMAGDPAKSGAFRDAGGLATAVNMTPWGNIFLQASSQFAKAYRRNPAGMTMGIFNGIAMPAIGITAWNAHLGREYSDYQFNVRTPDRQASAHYIGVPGRPPEEGVEVDIDPLMRPFKHLAELGAASQLGLLDGSFFKPENAELAQALRDMVTHRQFGFGEGSVPRSLMQQTLIPPMMPALQTTLAAGGVRARGYDDTRILNAKAGAEGFTEGTGNNPNVTLFGHHMPAQTEDVLRGLGSQAASNIYRMFADTQQRLDQGQSAKEALGAQGKSAKMRVADSTKMLGSGPLFDTFLAISPSTEAAGTLVKEKLDGLKKITAAFDAATLPGGTPSDMIGDNKRGFQQNMGQAPNAAPDLQMLQLGQLAKKVYSDLNTAHLGSNADYYDQRQAIQNSAKYSPEMKRALMNEQAFKIIENNRKMLSDIERYESVLSQQFGKTIRFDKINLDKGMAQQAQ